MFSIKENFVICVARQHFRHIYMFRNLFVCSSGQRSTQLSSGQRSTQLSSSQWSTQLSSGQRSTQLLSGQRSTQLSSSQWSTQLSSVSGLINCHLSYLAVVGLNFDLIRGIANVFLHSVNFEIVSSFECNASCCVLMKIEYIDFILWKYT
jgi:hypothetical protein